jgi:hypothetical protein
MKGSWPRKIQGIAKIKGGRDYSTVLKIRGGGRGGKGIIRRTGKKARLESLDFAYELKMKEAK